MACRSDASERNLQGVATTWHIYLVRIFVLQTGSAYSTWKRQFGMHPT